VRVVRKVDLDPGELFFLHGSWICLSTQAQRPGPRGV
jgi:hypothetical protein